MRLWKSVSAYAGVLAIGYLAGTSGLSFQTNASAQEKEKSKPNAKLTAAFAALNEAAEGLKIDGKYESITQGVNAFLVLSGGGNARADLEGGMGVDPETYAALYAGQAIPELQDQVKRDDNGRLIYNGQVVQMYSPSRLKKVYADRVKLAGSR